MNRALPLFILLAGCTTVQEINRLNGTYEYLIACGAAVGFDVCYARANRICPSGYTTVAERAGFNRKELQIACAERGNPRL